MLQPESNNKTRVLILGAGGHGRVVLDILLQRANTTSSASSITIPIFTADASTVFRSAAVSMIWKKSCAESGVGGVIIAIGDNGVRRGLARQVEQTGLELINAVHPSATLAYNATIGRNVVIAAGAVVCANCQIGDSVILNTGCIIDHQTMVGEGSHICPGVRIAGRVKVEPGVFIGIGATVVPKVTLGCEAIVGAGAVVLEDVLPMATVVGVPAVPIKLASASEDIAAMFLPART